MSVLNRVQKLSFWDRVRLSVYGFVCIGMYKKKGWINALPFYLARCKFHGYYINFRYGYEDGGGLLVCPKCVVAVGVKHTTGGIRTE